MRLLFIASLLLLANTDAFNIVCYYTSWAQYRPGKGKFVPENIDPTLCTHIIYAFAKPVGLDIQPIDWNEDGTNGMYSRVIKFKEINPNLKVLLSVGGWNMASAPFIPLIQKKNSRETFAKNVVNFLRKRNFDGFDLDWEYPGDRGGSPGNRPKFQLLMLTLKRIFQLEGRTSGKPRLLLSVAVAAGKRIIDNAYQPVRLARVVDFLNIMTYNFHGAWENTVGFNSPLFPYKDEIRENRFLNVDWAAKYWKSLGVDRNKIHIGITTYGRSFTLANPSQHSILSPTRGAGKAQPYSREAGIISYYEVCEFVKDGGAQIIDVPSQANRYAVKGDQWIGYDDPQSVYDKTCYARNQAFGGVFFWNLGFDDFNGDFCNNGTYPLIRSAKSATSFACGSYSVTQTKSVGLCRGVPCANGGRLMVDNSVWGHCRCRCLPGFVGPYCQYKLRGKRSVVSTVRGLRRRHTRSQRLEQINQQFLNLIPNGISSSGTQQGHLDSAMASVGIMSDSRVILNISETHNLIDDSYTHDSLSDRLWLLENLRR